MFSTIIVAPCPPFYSWEMIIGACIEQLAKKKKEKEAFILDRSGSMRRLEDDTIGGFNSVIDKQKKESRHGQCDHAPL